MSLPIESDIPIPSRSRRVSRRYQVLFDTFEKLEVGQSVSFKGCDTQSWSRVQRAANRYKMLVRGGWNYTSRKSQRRLWRTA